MIVLIFTLISTFAGTTTCLPLEGINIGCVSSTDHSCYMNKMVDKIGNCHYVGSPSTMWRSEGPKAFACKSTRNTTREEVECNADGCRTVIVTSSECIEYLPPLCEETCIQCFDEVVTMGIGVEKGCIVCTRAYCSDEPPATIACPTKYNNLINFNGYKCSSPSRCPTTAVDPLGREHNVIISRGTCPTPKMPEEPSLVIPQDCPWKADVRKNCSDPIPEEYKNP